MKNFFAILGAAAIIIAYLQCREMVAQWRDGINAMSREIHAVVEQNNAEKRALDRDDGATMSDYQMNNRDTDAELKKIEELEIQMQAELLRKPFSLPLNAEEIALQDELRKRIADHGNIERERAQILQEDRANIQRDIDARKRVLGIRPTPTPGPGSWMWQRHPLER